MNGIFRAILGCIGCIVPLCAQAHLNLSGLILDSSDAAVPGAAISVVNEETGFRRITQSQGSGEYLVASLQPGTYKIMVRKDGFHTMVRFGVAVGALQGTRVNFTLAVGSMQEVITVEGTAPLVNSDDASVSSVIGRNEIERLPVNGGALLNLLELTPALIVTPATRGESGQFTVDGQRPNTHYFTVDGASANTGVSGGGLPAQPTGGALPGMSAIGSIHSLISLESVEQFRVQTSSAVPEFGRMPGAQVSLNSRSGSNQLHGSLLYSFRHEDLAANDWFANRHGDGQAPLRMSDVAATFGGPIWRNRTFFFLSYEGMRLRQPFAWSIPVPSQQFRQNAPDWVLPLLNSFPAANGQDLGRGLAEWTGRNNRPAWLDVGSVRVDHAFKPRVTFFSRYNDSPSVNEFGSNQINRLDLRSKSVTAGLNVQARHDTIFDFRMNFSTASAHSVWTQSNAAASAPCYLEPATSRLLNTHECDFLVRFSIAGVGQLVSGREGDRAQNQFQVLEHVSLDRGSHSIRMGADYRQLTPSRHDAAGSLSIIADSLDSLTGFLNLWTAKSAAQDGSATLRELSLFAQDTWRMSSRLTATYGLRWEYSPPPSAEGAAVDVPEPIWPARVTNFAPRIGVAYRPWSNSQTVLRAGAGLYYDSSLSLATDLVNGGPFNIRGYKSGIYAPLVTTNLTFGFAPNLRLPAIKQWNISLEHAFGKSQLLSLSYAGSTGGDLIRRELDSSESFSAWVATATNRGASDYHGLQAQYRKNFSNGLQSRLSYSWSHSIDNSSSDAALHWTGPGSAPERDRGSSDFDVRHSLVAALSYETQHGSGIPRAFRRWAVDGILRVRSGFPITVLDSDEFLGLTFVNAFRPNLLGGVPVWLDDASAPGGKRLNRDAFQTAARSVQGSLGRNAIAGLGMSQLDMALRRDFAFGEKRSLQLRIEAFNAFNHPDFADPVKYLVNPLFGRSTSMLNLMLGSGTPGSGLAPIFQSGGARSAQVAVRFRF